MTSFKTQVSLLVIVSMFYFNAMAQTKSEKAIRELEQTETKAVLAGDTATLFKLWSPGLLVNNPADKVINAPQIMELIRAGKIDYAVFERIIENISITKNVAVVMGREELKPEGNTDNAGKVVIRRFTNVWMQDKSTWKLIARQATITSVK